MLSHLNEHRFNHNFEDCINPQCSCSLEVESTTLFFLHCHNFVNIRNTLLNKLNSISCDISNCLDRSLTKLILYENPKFLFQQNSDIINASIEYINNSKRFLCSLLWSNDTCLKQKGNKIELKILHLKHFVTFLFWSFLLYRSIFNCQPWQILICCHGLVFVLLLY